MQLNIDALLQHLAAKRPIFHSEADFQHALAWLLHEIYPDASMRLELPLLIDGKALHVNIWMTVGDTHVAIKLMYKPLALWTPYRLGDEVFTLRSHASVDFGRYGFIKDITEIEQVTSAFPRTAGYAVLLTNDPPYWSTLRNSPNFEAKALFCLEEGRTLDGVLGLEPTMKPNHKRGTLQIAGAYPLHWRDYSVIDTPKYGQFRYLAVAVTGS